jgi:hypothetical protein
MRNLKRNAALGGAAALLAALGFGGVVSAQAAPHDTTAPVVQKSDGGGEANDATQPPGAEEAKDGPDQGPDANPNEPGHQDADETGEPEGVEGAQEANDGPDQGPDANPNEPGHQDADETGEAA